MDEMRRPIKTRNFTIIKWLAKKITQTGIKPDHISMLSIGCSITVAIFFFLLSYWGNSVFALLAAFSIQARLLCNLLDGMVAIEGRKASPVGILFNEIPDRISDTIILVSAGYTITSVTWGPVLGWLAACLAIFTAYIRVLSSSIGAPTQFIGPMSKSHRMAALTLVCLSVPLEYYYHAEFNNSFIVGLLIINLGALVTLIKRTQAIAQFLNNRT